MKLIDLHTHTLASDGTDSAEVLIEKAVQANLSAVAITDHDCLDSLQDAEQKAHELGIEFIRGVEISANYTRGEIHILGYWFDSNPCENKELEKAFNKLIGFREVRNEIIFDKFRRLGIDLTFEEVAQYAGKQHIIGRPHFAHALVARGVVKDIKEAFTLYLGMDGKAYEPKQKLEPKEAIDLLRDAGAVVSLAHPFLIFCDNDKREGIVAELKSYGLQAIEAYYSEHSEQATRICVDWAVKYNLALSGGSDYHGTTKPHVSIGKGKGSLRINYDILEKLKNLK